MVEIKAVESPEQISQVCALAETIWTEHYAPIIGMEQVRYMLGKFQSLVAVQDQLSTQGYQYFLLRYSEQNAGYLAIQAEDSTLFLSKIYIHKAFRGNRIASDAVAFLTGLCAERGLHKIWLTVNKHNAQSIAAYKKLGFVITGEQEADIGNGYVMDDYMMEKTVESH